MIKVDERKKNSGEGLDYSDDNKERDETSSQYSPSESGITDEPGDNRSDIANLNDVESEFGDDSEPTFWHSARRIVSQTFSSLYLGFINGATIGNPNFTKRYGKSLGLVATYATAAMCGGMKSPVGLKRDRDDKRYWAFSITARQTWLTGAGFIGYLAGRANSQKIAKIFFGK